NDPHSASAAAKIWMHWRSVEPRERRRFQIKIDKRRETEREVRSRELCAICFDQFRMLLERVVTERALIADMNVRVDQPRNQKPAVAINHLGVLTRNEISPDLDNFSVTDRNRRVGEGTRPLR